MQTLWIPLTSQHIFKAKPVGGNLSVAPTPRWRLAADLRDNDDARTETFRNPKIRTSPTTSTKTVIAPWLILLFPCGCLCSVLWMAIVEVKAIKAAIKPEHADFRRSHLVVCLGLRCGRTGIEKEQWKELW